MSIANNFDTSSIQQQIDNMKQDQELFQKEQENKEKVHAAQGELRKDMTKALIAAKHGKQGDEPQAGAKVPSGQAALIMALESQIDANMDNMRLHANTLVQMTPEMQREGSYYDQISADQDSLAQADPDTLNEQSAAIKAELLVATSETNTTATAASAESHAMAQDSSLNSGLTGMGSFLVRAITDKLGNYSRA